MDRYNNGFGRKDYDQEDRRENDATRREQQRKQTEQDQRSKKTTSEERPMKNEPSQDYDDVGKTEKKGSWW